MPMCSTCLRRLLLLFLLFLLVYQNYVHNASWDEAPDEEGGLRALQTLKESLNKWFSSLFIIKNPSRRYTFSAFLNEEGVEGEVQDKDASGEKGGVILRGEGPKHYPSRWHLRSQNHAHLAEWRFQHHPRRLQLLEEGALKPLKAANFTGAGLRRAPPYQGYTNCFFTQQCANITTNYGNVARCKNVRVCEVCRQDGPEVVCGFFVVTGNPGKLTARTPFTTNPLVE
jgi:hypothetical protein